MSKTASFLYELSGIGTNVTTQNQGNSGVVKLS